MENYRHFSPERLAADDSFRRWIIESAHTDSLFWEKWLRENPDKKELVEKAVLFIHDAQVSLEHVLHEDEIRFEIAKLSASVQQSKLKKKAVSIPLWCKFAAAILLILSLSNLNTGNERYVLNENLFSSIIGKNFNPVIIETNLTSLPKLILLPDQSSVVLQPKSKLTFPVRFQPGKREIYLEGQAFFEITKNPESPFFVYTRSVSTKVLGTSFTVTAFPDQTNATVTVKTGKVSVFPSARARISSEENNPIPNETILMPNQQVQFSNDEQLFTKNTISETGNPELSILHQSFSFKKTPIREVFRLLEKSYGTHIEFPAEKMENCYLTASLSDEPLLEKLLLICRTIGAEYQISEQQITIRSNGCN